MGRIDTERISKNMPSQGQAPAVQYPVVGMLEKEKFAIREVVGSIRQ